MISFKKSWIFSRSSDIALYLAGPLCFLSIVDGISPPILVAISVWISLVIFDSGHVYLSYLRTYKEFRSIRGLFYWGHLTFFIFFFLMQWQRIPYLWHLVVYATYFHFLRQFFGIYRRYLLKEDDVSTSDRKLFDILFYSLTLLPTLCFHFREDFGDFGYYAKIDTFRHPNQKIFVTILALNYVALLVWGCIEYLRMKKKGNLSLWRVLYLGSTFLLFNLVFVFSKTKMQVIAPLVLAHGLQYYFFIGDSLNRNHKFELKKILILFLFFGVLAGILSSLWEEAFLLDYSYLKEFELGSTFSISMLLTFLFFHYFIDAFIWKRAYFLKLEASER